MADKRHTQGAHTMNENKKHRQTIADCARTREYPPEYREDGTKMSLAERAALAPTMPVRSTPKTSRYECKRDVYIRIADIDAGKDDLYNRYF